MTSIPANSVTVNHWYKQNVYDPNENKIGDIKDVLVDKAIWIGYPWDKADEPVLPSMPGEKSV